MDSFEPRMNPRFLVESEKGMLREPRVIESGGWFQGRRKGKEESFCFVVVHHTIYRLEERLGVAVVPHWPT